MIGAQKSGTTSLFSYLTEHPQVLSNPLNYKEIYFFNKTYERGLNFYKHYFPLNFWKGLVGEASTTYLHSQKAPQRVSKDLPSAKLIVILRDPVERAISHYYHHVKRGREARSIDDAFSLEIIEQFNAGELEDSLSFRYLHNGDYGVHLEQWLKYFNATQLYIGNAEDLFSDPQSEFDQVCDFLEIERQQMARFSVQNKGMNKSHNSEILLRLREFYKPKVMHLNSLGLGTLDWEHYE